MKSTFALGLLAGSAAASCNADSCLRALRATQIPGRLQAAQAFCNVYTGTAATATGTGGILIPTYAAVACSNDAARVSSACACVGAAVTATGNSTAAPTSVASSSFTASTVSVSKNSTTAAPTATEPCALASSAWSSASASHAYPTPRIPAELAYNCLKSVPLGQDAAIKLVDSLVPYLEWQSDAGYKANPPASYEYPAVDIFSELAKDRAKLVAGSYDSEYAFQSELYANIFGAGHDGHLVFYPDLLTKVFEFGRQRSLLSISEDGTSLPVIKVYEDVVTSPETASVVTKINGEDATSYLEKTTYAASFNQDKDAAYNSMFFSLPVKVAAEGVGYFAGGGRIRYIYHGANTTLTFANGTEAVFENFASVKSSLFNINNGTDMYSRFCGSVSVADATVANVAEDATTPTAAATPAPTPIGVGYPTPIDTTSDNIVSCYFLEGEGFENVAVLSLLAFESNSIVEFQAVTQNCIKAAKAAGRTKMVIDFAANGGGYILLGYDFFRQFFPQTVQDGNSRWKANAAYVAISELVSESVKNLDPYTSADSDSIGWYESWFNARYDLDTDDKHFTSLEAKLGAHEFQGTEYTSLMRWDLNDNLTTTNGTYGMGIEITGYGSLANLTQPFAAEDIVLLYDGFCASTCTIASEFLRLSGGVKSIALGGRPVEGPIQGVGGIKGSQVLSFSNIYSYAAQAKLFAANAEQTAALERYTYLPMRRSSASSVNVRDQILKGNVEDGIPAQFVTEEADCRLYYTAEMATDVTASWKAAANAAFNGGKCAAGGISSSRSHSRVDARNRRPRTESARDKAARLAKRASVASLVEVELEVKKTKDMDRFNAIYNQRAVV